MIDSIVHSSEPVTLLGGGAATLDDIEEARALAPICVAADGGAELARRAGVELTAVIGDFDSVTPETLALIPAERQHHIAEQNSTDFGKAMRNISAPVVLGVGFTGARLDHQLGALHVLVSHPERPCVLLGAGEIVFLCPRSIKVPTQAGDVVSLFPMGAVTGRSVGLRWDLAGLQFDPMTQIGTLNEATGPIELTMDGPAMIVVLPRRYLGDVMQALASVPPDARWPARAARYTDPTQS